MKKLDTTVLKRILTYVKKYRLFVFLFRFGMEHIVFDVWSYTVTKHIFVILLATIT